MPLTQEKHLDNNFSNNNDQSYLHKKFKKMATTVSVYPNNPQKSAESRYMEASVCQAACNSSISNGSIAAAHPEIEKIKENNTIVQESAKNVQTNFKEESGRFSDVNNIVQMTGQTSFADEFLNKTENHENDPIKETYNAGASGRYMCPYCKISCAKPSVLQKHIRAHTNERPYPCAPCGFAFKTKSNLYKHRRSRTHALRLQGADVSVTITDEDLSGESESDTSLPAASVSESETTFTPLESLRPNEFSSPELTNDGSSAPMGGPLSSNIKLKTIYKPKFRAALYHENDDRNKLKKTVSHSTDYLTEHISRIISINEAIVDVIETPLQKKYGKIKQIAESKQFLQENETRSDQSPLNLTKSSGELELSFRKRSLSESISNTDQKHPLNPEGSIIKDLLLKTKANGLASIAAEIEAMGLPLFACPVCQSIFKSAEVFEAHRVYYCKGNPTSANIQKDTKSHRSEHMFVRSNSVNVRLSDSQPVLKSNKSPPLRNKPDNLIIMKPDNTDIIAPLPSPGPLLGNTRLVDTRNENKKCENMKVKSIISPKRRMDSRSDSNYSPRLSENISPQSTGLYTQCKIRCLDANSPSLRPFEDMPHLRHNSTSLQMFGGEVKIVDHLGSTTTLRIEPSKNQLSPILVHPNLTASKLSADSEGSNIVVKSGLHSGGTMLHNPPTPKDALVTASQLRISKNSLMPNVQPMHDLPHFQFPPLSAITAYNPLTLPPLSPSQTPTGASTILHGGKLIPHVPGMPGPITSIFNTSGQIKTVDVTQSSTEKPRRSPSINVQAPISASNESKRNAISPLRSPIDNDINRIDRGNVEKSGIHHTVPIIKIKNVDDVNVHSKMYSSNVVKPIVGRQEAGIKRNVDGVPKMHNKDNNYPINRFKTRDKATLLASPKYSENKSESDIKNFNFENLITKAEIYNNQIPSTTDVQKNATCEDASVSIPNERSETSYFQKSSNKSPTEERKPKFLRPSTLPLKPGTFTPKKHHGITPNANTMPLVSPETPRPAKAYGQLYLNGNAYTYLGLKCSTKVFYCTINRPQPTYVTNQHLLSMYSNWQLLSELTPDPLGLSASSAMSLYDSRHRPQNVTVAPMKHDLILTHSSRRNENDTENKQVIPTFDHQKYDDSKFSLDNMMTPKKELAGGFESNEEYTYVRGRGRGRYVCSECGIRCKKPSMLKKHIRTHTDVRPFTCVHCAFSFKTKGNLTKHMKSKAHYKKCCELGINPNEGTDIEGSEMLPSGETDEETESDGDEGNEGETESSDTEACKSRLPEHEAAHCLLSLGGSRPATASTPGLITSARPTTYPYTPIDLENGIYDVCSENLSISGNASHDSRSDAENEPMDLSKNEVKTLPNITEIPTARESSVLASLASNTAKLPQHQSQWSNGEPMLHTYLTERALQDSKIKQSQVSSNLIKLRKVEVELPVFQEKSKIDLKIAVSNDSHTITSSSAQVITTSKMLLINDSDNATSFPLETKDELPITKEVVEPKRSQNNNAENAKHVVSEYLKQARINLIKSQEENSPNKTDSYSNENRIATPENIKENSISEETTKLSSIDHDPVARKVVIGAGGVAFKVTKGKEFENASYSPGRLMEDGRRVCDFCNKTFTKPSQLKLHLNIHYMERPFRCSVCAVSFRTRGHLQKHERSGSHHSKVSMTSTFGAATSFNPRPFRCSDCNIAFRIHGHLAKHLRSKMHVMRLECLFKLPFGTFTEIERAGVSLTDIDTTDCASSLASLQTLARKLHEKDPSKLEYRDPSTPVPTTSAGRESSEDEDGSSFPDRPGDSDKDSEMFENSESHEKETKVNYSATD